MTIILRGFIAIIALACLTSCSKNAVHVNDHMTQSNNMANRLSSAVNGVIVIKASGDVDTAISEFRQLLGELNTSPGAKGGRREINWDGVPANFVNNDLFPGDFFGAFDPLLPNGRKRGLISTTPGSGFSISDNDFLFINDKYPDQFEDFSPSKTFAAVGSTITDNFFKVPGTNIDATIKGFGVVFSDVNKASSSSLEFFDGTSSLGVFKVPNVGNNSPGGFSFLGVYFSGNKVTRVRIRSGSSHLSPAQDDLSDGGGEDLVVMDDFIYSEPE